MAGRTLILNQRAIQAWLSQRGGPMDQVMKGIAEQVRREAVRRAPRGKGRGSIGGKPLSQTIEVSSFTTKNGPVYKIFSKSPKAAWVHGLPGQPGTPPHVIRPRNRKGAMVFHWDRVGKTMVFKVIKRHPGIAITPKEGNKGVQPFLTDALDAVRKRLK